MEANPDFIYYKPNVRNFGDFLNEYLINEIRLSNLNHLTLGIGSILTEKFLKQNKLTNRTILTLGSGCRKSSESNVVFANGSFVRGPLSARVYENKVEFISDGAYLLRQFDSFHRLLDVTKKYKLSIVPYFRSFPFVDWNLFELETGIHVIDPRVPHGIDHTLQEIAKSERIIAEAMHGGIMADILRIPWVQLDFLASSFEGKLVNNFKWTDWQLSIQQVECKSINTCTYHTLISKTSNYTLKKKYLGLLKNKNQKKLLKTFKKGIDLKNFYLSSDATIKKIDYKMSGVLKNLKNA